MLDVGAATWPVLAQAGDGSAAAVPWAGSPLLAFGLVGLIAKILTVAAQVLCIVHVIRRREDYWWIFLILFVPVVGALVYVIVVVWPEWRQRARWRRGGTGRVGAGQAQRRVRQLERQLALSDTVENRAALAAAYCEAGQYTRSRQCYEGCMQGLYADDAHLLFGLAKACFGEGRFERCLECAARVDRREVPEHVNALDLLQARALLALGRDREGIEALRAVAPRASGLEPWWRLAEAQARCGQEAEADQVCRRLLEDAARLGPASRKRDKEWIALARQRLKARNRTSTTPNPQTRTAP